MADKQKVQSYWLNRGQMAKSHGISVQAFDNWEVEPVAKIGRQKFFLAGDVTANRVRHKITMMEKNRPAEIADGDIDYDLERARLTKEQADGQELKNAQARRELAPIDLIEWTLGRFAAQVCPLLEAIPQKVKRRVPSLKSAEVEIIKREIIKAQNMASKITVNVDAYSADH